jgi:hypothetical protein
VKRNCKSVTVKRKYIGRREGGVRREGRRRDSWVLLGGGRKGDG